MSDIIKKPDAPSVSLKGGVLRSKQTSFQERTNASKARSADASTLPNRLALMLDCSSSMTGSKIDLLKQAVENFVNRCAMQDTALALETFPAVVDLALNNVGWMIIQTAQSLRAAGNTPMHACAERCLDKIPMTRGIIVSDGEATDWHQYHYDDWDEEEGKPKPTQDDLLIKYKAAGIPIDCVHIGDSTSGEDLLRHIAKETGGVYLKFTDVSAFANAFGYLTPSYRAMLTSGSVSAASLGAKEIQR
jgi:Mg-chelatase subunit ChlD